MRLVTGSAMVLALTLSLGGQEPARGSDDEAVRGLVRRYAEAREKRDAAAVAGLFTADADHLVSSGEWRLGRENVVTGSLASTAESGGKRELLVERVRFMSKESAIADARYSITGLQAGDRRMWSTFVCVREAGGGWKIAAIRNMLPAPPVARGPGDPLD